MENKLNNTTSGGGTGSGVTTGPDILEMVHSYVNVPSGTPVTLQHSVKYIQFQINQHRHTKEELDHLKRKKGKRAARKSNRKCKCLLKGR